MISKEFVTRELYKGKWHNNYFDDMRDAKKCKSIKLDLKMMRLMK